MSDDGLDTAGVDTRTRTVLFAAVVVPSMWRGDLRIPLRVGPRGGPKTVLKAVADTGLEFDMVVDKSTFEQNRSVFKTTGKTVSLHAPGGVSLTNGPADTYAAEVLYEEVAYPVEVAVLAEALGRQPHVYVGLPFIRRAKVDLTKLLGIQPRADAGARKSDAARA